MSGRLERKTALVTGGTRGIGLAIARRFCEEGAQVTITGTPKGNGVQTAIDLREEGHDVCFDPVDMADVGSIRRMVARVAARCTDIDVLVNNAGISGRGTFGNLDATLWDRTLNVNLRGPAFCMEAVRLHMARRGGSIINIASIAGEDAPVGSAAYAASKAGLIAVSKAAAKEFARDKIRVNVVAPGVIETGMATSMAEHRRADLMGRTPLGTMGSPTDIANACVFLASEESAFITDAVLRVDGGLRL